MERKRKNNNVIRGSLLHRVIHLFPTFLFQHFDCLLHHLWLFLCNEDGPMWCPEGIISPLIKCHTFFCTVQECMFWALVDCQLHLLCGGGVNAQKYNPFQAFHSLQNVFTSLKAAVLAPAVRIVDPKKCNQPFPCHEFHSNYISTVPSLASGKKLKQQTSKF